MEQLREIANKVARLVNVREASIEDMAEPHLLEVLTNAYEALLSNVISVAQQPGGCVKKSG